MGRTWTRAAVAALSGLVLAGAAAPAAAHAQGPDGTWLVQLAPGAALPRGAEVVRDLAGVGMAVVTATAQEAAALRTAPGVTGVTPDGGVQLAQAAPTTTAGLGSLASTLTAAGADATRLTGAGVDVAVVDSGVAPVPGLTGAKVVHGPDLSFESQRASTRYLDTYGHGTHLAGIIAGSDPATGFRGLAPGARVVSVKVADARGAADVSQVIAGIDWVVENKDAGDLDVRVLNLSFGTPALQSHLRDPLSHAVEAAWHRGLVVVVSAGNEGAASGRLLNPAQDPYVIAVGASDHRGTASPADDGVAAFSSRGDGTRNPDLLAPGRSIASLRVPGSWVDTAYGATANVGTQLTRGSGTSQSAAVVSGAVALLLEQRPGLSPDQVKALLRSTADPVAGADARAQGAGRLDVAGALAAATPWANQVHLRSSGTGSLDLARGGYRLQLDGAVLQGERDVWGRSYSGALRGAAQTTGTAWVGSTWNGSSLVTGRVVGGAYEVVAWTGRTWAGDLWAGRTWASGQWNGRTWAEGSWTGRTWAGAGWAGRSWAANGWAANGWASTWG